MEQSDGATKNPSPTDMGSELEMGGDSRMIVANNADDPFESGDAMAVVESTESPKTAPGGTESPRERLKDPQATTDGVSVDVLRNAETMVRRSCSTNRTVASYPSSKNATRPNRTVDLATLQPIRSNRLASISQSAGNPNRLNRLRLPNCQSAGGSRKDGLKDSRTAGQPLKAGPIGPIRAIRSIGWELHRQIGSTSQSANRSADLTGRLIVEWQVYNGQ